MKIVVDCGHGGSDPGTVVDGIQEKDITLKIGLLVADFLRKRGHMVYMTRTTDTTVPVDERTSFANTSDADLLISLHANYSPCNQTSGLEIYFPSRELFTPQPTMGSQELSPQQKSIIDAALHEHCQTSECLAQRVHTSIMRALRTQYPGVIDRGIRKATMQLLAGSTLPAVIIELGYLSHAEELERIVHDAQFLPLFARAIGDIF